MSPCQKRGVDMKNSKRIAVACGAVGLMIFAANCTKQSSSSNNSAAGNQSYQSPSGSCQISNNGTVLLTVTNSGLSQNFNGLFQPPQAPGIPTFNCSGSASHAPAPQNVLSATYSVNGGPATAFNNGLQASGAVLNAYFANPGANTVVITLMDGAGLQTVMTFQLPVSCNPASYPNFFGAGGGPSGVNVAAGANGPGWFNFTLQGGASGGKGPYVYAMDFNGDGRMDFNDTSTPVYWSSPGAAPLGWWDIYNFYSGTRPVVVQSYDQGCQFLRTDTFSVNWAPLLPAQTGWPTVPASQPAYSYLQANVSPGAGNTPPDPAETVTPFNAQDATATRVSCQFSEQGNNGVPTAYLYNIAAVNTYSDGVQADQGPLTESSSLSFQASPVNTLQTGLPLQSVTYQTSASFNGQYQQYAYNMGNTPCTVNVIFLPGAPGPCQGTGQTGLTWGGGTATGTFSCDGMQSNPGGRTLNLDQGYFYCAFAAGSSCVGGGQEGGSSPGF